MQPIRHLLTIAAATVLAFSALLAGCSSDDSGDESADDNSSVQSDDDGQEDPETVLALEVGASLTLPGANKDGQVTDETPFTVAFDVMTCDASFPNAAYDFSGETEDGQKDLAADGGNQICIVELEVTNESTGPGFFSSANSATARTEDGIEYSETGKDFDDQGWLGAKDREPSYTTDNVQPGMTKYDVIAFELPADATPVELVYTIYTFQG